MARHPRRWLPSPCGGFVFFPYFAFLVLGAQLSIGTSLKKKKKMGSMRRPQICGPHHPRPRRWLPTLCGGFVGFALLSLSGVGGLRLPYGPNKKKWDRPPIRRPRHPWPRRWLPTLFGGFVCFPLLSLCGVGGFPNNETAATTAKTRDALSDIPTRLIIGMGVTQFQALFLTLLLKYVVFLQVRA